MSVKLNVCKESSSSGVSCYESRQNVVSKTLLRKELNHASKRSPKRLVPGFLKRTARVSSEVSVRRRRQRIGKKALRISAWPYLYLRTCLCLCVPVRRISVYYGLVVIREVKPKYRDGSALLKIVGANRSIHSFIP